MAKMTIKENKEKFNLRGWIIFLPVMVYLIGLIIGAVYQPFNIEAPLAVAFVTLLLFVIFGAVLIWYIKHKIVLAAINIIFVIAGFITSIIAIEHTALSKWLCIVIFTVSAIISLLLSIVIAVFIKQKLQETKSKKYVKKVLSDEYIESLIVAFGGKENIVSATNSISRLKVRVNDVDDVDLNKIQEISKKGVFVAGKDVQVVFEEEAVTYLQYYFNNNM